MTTSREIKSALTKAFKGVKFSVRTENILCETIKVEWTGYPFINEVKAITEPWNTFEDHSDTMTDYFSYSGTKIEFTRNLSQDEIDFLSVGIPVVYHSNVDGYEITFDYDRQRFEAIGAYKSWELCRENNQALREWGINGLAVSLEESPQSIESARQDHEKEIENARKELEEKRGKLIQGDYDGTPADDNLDHIIIHWHEGFNFIAPNAKFKSFKSAHNAIVKCCEFHADTNVGKMAFSIVFRDGEVYEGRLYLSPNEDNYLTTDNVIGKHCVKFLQYYADKGEIESQEYLDKYRFEDTALSDNIIHLQLPVRDTKTDNHAIASEWLIDDNQITHITEMSEADGVKPTELQKMFTESVELKVANDMGLVLTKYSQWVANKVATNQHSKIISFDDWLEIYTMA